MSPTQYHCSGEHGNEAHWEPHPASLSRRAWKRGSLGAPPSIIVQESMETRLTGSPTQHQCPGEHGNEAHWEPHLASVSRRAWKRGSLGAPPSICVQESMETRLTGSPTQHHCPGEHGNEAHWEPHPASLSRRAWKRGSLGAPPSIIVQESMETRLTGRGR